jgi:hypothetical protein
MCEWNFISDMPSLYSLEMSERGGSSARRDKRYITCCSVDSSFSDVSAMRERFPERFFCSLLDDTRIGMHCFSAENFRRGAC